MPAKAKKYTLGTAEQLFDLECPSGQTCQVRRPGPQGLIDAGLLDSLDTLTGLIKTEHLDRVDGKINVADVKAFVANTSSVRDGLQLMNRVVIYCVVQPELHPAPVPRDKCTRCGGTGVVQGTVAACPDCTRIPGLAYVDQVDLEDQAFIMQYVMGGTKSLETFRTERAELLGDVQGGNAVQLSSQ